MELTLMHNEFANYTLPKEVKELYKLGLGANMFGPKNFARVMFFAQEKEITNFVIDHYMGIKPARQEGEDRADYKNRLKFQKVLYKYRKYLYDYSVFEKPKTN
jgi:hypothetical protein